MGKLNSRNSLLAGAVAAIGASACCVGPLVLVMLGVSGAWIGYLVKTEPVRPFLMGASMLFVGLAFRKLYVVRPACADDSCCPDERALKRQRVVFWLVTVPLVLLLTFPWYAEFLF